MAPFSFFFFLCRCVSVSASVPFLAWLNKAREFFRRLAQGARLKFSAPLSHEFAPVAEEAELSFEFALGPLAQADGAVS